MKLDMRMSDRPIRIKKGTNWKTIVISMIFLIVAVACATSKYWAPDDREIMMYNTDNDITFRNMKVNLTDYRVDLDKGLGEITLLIDQTLIEDRLSYEMEYDGTYAYQDGSYKVIEGSMLPNADSDGYVQEVMIQYSLPDDYWYISLKLSQEENKTEEIKIDYRKQKKSILTDKGDDYMKNFDEINLKLITQEKTVSELTEITTGYRSSVDELQKKIDAEETKLKIITDKKMLEEKQKVIDNDKKALEAAQQNLSEKQKALKEAEKALGELYDEKEKQR